MRSPLFVADLDAMTAFYSDVIPLEVQDATRDTVTLGRARTPLVVLHHSPSLSHAAAGSARLFHTAIVFESQAALASALFSVAQHAPQTFTGSADHLVSQAFYLTDPEGNGIELYWDRDRTASLGDQALFVSAGGYHHHMAMNVWNSRGAGPRMPALGLGRVDLALPSADAIGELAERLRHYGTTVRDDGKTLSFEDPWNNTLHAAATA